MLLTAGLFVAGASCGRVVGEEIGSSVPVVGPPQWAMFSATPQRNGRSEFVGPRFGQHRALTLTEPDVDDAEVIVEAVGPRGTVYVLVRRDQHVGHLLALEPDGLEIWRYPEGDAMAIGGLALGAEGDLYLSGMQVVPDADPTSPLLNLYFKLSANGGVQWSWHPPGSAGLVPLERHGGPVYDGNGSSYAIHPALYAAPSLELLDRCLNAYGSDGELQWQWERDLGTTVIPPAIGPLGNLHVVISRDSPPLPTDEGLYVLNDRGEELRYTPLLNQSVYTLAVGDEGESYVAGFDNGLQMFTAINQDGGIDWSVRFPLPHLRLYATTTTAISAEGTLYVGAKASESDFGVGGALLAISQEGELLWSFETAGSPCGGIAVDATGAVYALTYHEDQDSVLVGVNSDGELILDIVVEGDSRECSLNDVTFFSSSVILADGGRVYFGSDDGKLHMIESHPEGAEYRIPGNTDATSE